ncbi:MAG: ZIP family metal transporter [Alphaproteobacteria bacterium]
MVEALALALLAGAGMPIGGVLAAIERIRPRWLEDELRHGIIAFGGGLLLSAVALVLIPEGLRHLGPVEAGSAFLGGGIVFLLMDRIVTQRLGSAANFLAMLTDFVPEAIALGALFAIDPTAGVLIALLITLQNIPEGFNAYREIHRTGRRSGGRTIAMFGLLALIGPAAAYLGVTYFSDRPQLTGLLMLFAAGGILYLTFHDIAPQAKLERHWLPGLGAVAGFLVGLMGEMLLASTP